MRSFKGEYHQVFAETKTIKQLNREDSKIVLMMLYWLKPCSITPSKKYLFIHYGVLHTIGFPLKKYRSYVILKATFILSVA